MELVKTVVVPEWAEIDFVRNEDGTIKEEPHPNLPKNLCVVAKIGAGTYWLSAAFAAADTYEQRKQRWREVAWYRFSNGL